MSERPQDPETLWQAVARSQEPVVRDRAALERLRARIIIPRQPRELKWSLPWVGALAAGLAMTAIWFATWRRPSFRVGGSEGSVGMVLSAEAGALPVRFADGSEVVLSPRARGRVNRLSDSGAEVVLTGGSIEAHVVHSAATRWVFHAGPFEIVVTGTRFVATWQPETQTLDVHMKEGSVRVAGGGLDKDVPVRAGQRFTASEGTESYSLREQTADPNGLAITNQAQPMPLLEGGPAPTETSDLLRPSAVGPSSVAPSRPTPPSVEPALPESPGKAKHKLAAANPPVAPTDSSAQALEGGRGAAAGKSEKPLSHGWAVAAAAGDHQHAFELAQKRGLERLTQELNAPDLLLLADTARYVDQPAPAAAAFLALVNRFPSSAEATDALFGLGRLAFQQRSWREASVWFQKVVDQPRRGPLAEAAWGRLMESLDRANDQAAIQRAQQYLSRFPHGQHRALAERICAGASR